MKNSSKPTVRPKTKQELKDLIEFEIKTSGNRCDLNHIDVSLMTDFSWLFRQSEFNGDISMWDVSRAKSMGGMFDDSKFNGDISGWNVSGVKSMGGMFDDSKFNGDISRWDVSGVINMNAMFYQSKFNGDISSWNRSSLTDDINMFFDSRVAKNMGTEDPTFDQVKGHFVNIRLGADLQEATPAESSPFKARL